MPLPTEPVNRPLRIVFMGTPDFAVPTLEGLLQGGDEVVLVVTQPDRPKGRGKKVVPSPVKVLACSAGVEVFQPQKIRQRYLQPCRIEFQPDILLRLPPLRNNNVDINNTNILNSRIAVELLNYWLVVSNAFPINIVSNRVSCVVKIITQKSCNLSF